MTVTDLLIKNVEEIKIDIKDIRKDIRKFYAFKWKIMGGAIVMVALSSFLGSALLSIINPEQVKWKVDRVGFEHGNGKALHQRRGE